MGTVAQAPRLPAYTSRHGLRGCIFRWGEYVGEPGPRGEVQDLDWKERSFSQPRREGHCTQKEMKVPREGERDTQSHWGCWAPLLKIYSDTKPPKGNNHVKYFPIPGVFISGGCQHLRPPDVRDSVSQSNPSSWHQGSPRYPSFGVQKPCPC